MVRLTQKGQSRYDQILEQAGRLFNNKGYTASSMDEIAAACACDVANLYNYFLNKEHILYNGIKTMISGAIAITETVENDGSLGPAGKLKETIRRQLEGRAEMGYTDLFSKYRSNLEPDHVKELVALRDIYEYKLRDIILDGIACGEFRKVDEKLAAIMINSLVERFLIWYSPQGCLTTSQIAEAFYDFLISGIGEPGQLPKALEPAGRVPVMLSKSKATKKKDTLKAH
jgi:TetR/AcrR family transcriptional regulator, cholesterol catabolism regulator